MLHDLKSACRVFINRPGFALLAVILLAVGIGASTTVFSVANMVLIDVSA